MRANTNPDVFISEGFQLRDELNDMGEVVSIEHLTTIILDALPTEKYWAMKIQYIKDPDLGLEEIMNITKVVCINHSERSSVPKMIQESYRERHDSGRERTMNGRESAMATVITCHNCKTPGHKNQNCNHLNEGSDKSGNLENSKQKWCSYHRGKGCYQRQSETASGNFGITEKHGVITIIGVAIR